MNYLLGQMIHMKGQAIFSQKKKKRMSSVTILNDLLRVNYCNNPKYNWTDMLEQTA